METLRQSPWDNVGSIAAVSGEEVNRQTTGGTDEGGTDDGSWWLYNLLGVETEHKWIEGQSTWQCKRDVSCQPPSFGVVKDDLRTIR